MVAGEFSLENGSEQLSGHFADVQRFDRNAALHVPDLEPLVANAASLPGVDERQVAAFADPADARLVDGPPEIEKSMGVFVCEVTPEP